MAKPSVFEARSEPKVVPSYPVNIEPTVTIAARLPFSTKRKFDVIAFEMQITKQELLKRMIEAYAEAIDERG